MNRDDLVEMCRNIPPDGSVVLTPKQYNEYRTMLGCFYVGPVPLKVNRWPTRLLGREVMITS